MAAPLRAARPGLPARRPALHRRPARCLRGRALHVALIWAAPGLRRPARLAGPRQRQPASPGHGEAAACRVFRLLRQCLGLPQEEGPLRGGGQAVAVATEEPAARAAQSGRDGRAPSSLRFAAVTHLPVSVTAPRAREQHESSGFNQVTG